MLHLNPNYVSVTLYSSQRSGVFKNIFKYHNLHEIKYLNIFLADHQENGFTVCVMVEIVSGWKVRKIVKLFGQIVSDWCLRESSVVPARPSSFPVEQSRAELASTPRGHRTLLLLMLIHHQPAPATFYTFYTNTSCHLPASSDHKHLACEWQIVLSEIILS